MFFVYVDEIKTSFVVGGSATLHGAKKLAENRSTKPLTWKQTDTGYKAVVDFGTYSYTYRIEQGER